MKIFIIHDNPRFSSHIQYAMERLCEPVECVEIIFDTSRPDAVASDDMVIHFGVEPDPGIPCDIFIADSGLFSGNYLTPDSAPDTPLESFEDLPILFGNKTGDDAWVETSRRQVISRIDLVAGVFFLLTRYEEIISGERDEYDRFPAESSLMTSAGLIRRPLADEYSDLFCSWLKLLRPDIRFRDRWRGHRYRLYVTHDVDVLSKFSWKNMLTGRQSPVKGLTRVAGLKRDPWWNLEEVAGLDEEYGVKAEYFFLAGGNTKLDGFYDIRKKSITNVIHQLKKRGCRIGIHFSLSSHLEMSEISNVGDSFHEFRENMEQFISATGIRPEGSRQHYLGFSAPDTFHALESIGIRYDATLGFSKTAGFRCGTCRPFPCFDAVTGEKIDLVETPLIAMDTTFIHHKGYSPEESLEVMKSLLEEVVRRNGVFCLLWHNNTLDEEEYPGWTETYRKFLEVACSHDPELTGDPF